MTDPIMLSPLFSLPREIRDLIYMQCIHIRADPPPDASLILFDHADKRVQYPAVCQTHYPPLPLLTVNRQIRAEIRSLLAALRATRRLSCTLALFAVDWDFLPSWTALTLGIAPGSRVSTLTFDVTVCAANYFDRERRQPHRTSLVLDHLLCFLHRVLYFGPACLDTAAVAGARAARPLFVETFVVRVRFRDACAPATLAVAVREVMRVMRALAGLATAEQFLGRIRVQSEYRYWGKEVKEEAEWQVRAENWDEDEMLRGDRAWMERSFGEAWKNRFWHQYC